MRPQLLLHSHVFHPLPPRLRATIWSRNGRATNSNFRLALPLPPADLLCVPRCFGPGLKGTLLLLGTFAGCRHRGEWSPASSTSGTAGYSVAASPTTRDQPTLRRRHAAALVLQFGGSGTIVHTVATDGGLPTLPRALEAATPPIFPTSLPLAFGQPHGAVVNAANKKILLAAPLPPADPRCAPQCLGPGHEETVHLLGTLVVDPTVGHF